MRHPKPTPNIGGGPCCPKLGQHGNASAHVAPRQHGLGRRATWAEATWARAYRIFYKYANPTHEYRTHLALAFHISRKKYTNPTLKYSTHLALDVYIILAEKVHEPENPTLDYSTYLALGVSY